MEQHHTKLLFKFDLNGHKLGCHCKVTRTAVLSFIDFKIKNPLYNT